MESRATLRAVRSLALVLVTLSCLACGPKLPPRYVVEQDIGDARYRRYQKVLDIEIPVAGNPAVGHTATYAERGSTLHITPVFVTVYQRAHGLTETVRTRLRAMPGYEVSPREVDGEHVWLVEGESRDRWIVWASSQHLVKLGVPEGAREPNADVLEAYLDLYPSDLDERGRAKPGAASAGAATEPPTEEK